MTTTEPRPTHASESLLGLLAIVATLAIAAGLVYAMSRTWTGWHTVLVLGIVGTVAGIHAWRPRPATGEPTLLPLIGAADSLDQQRRVSAANALDQIRSRQMRDGLLTKPTAPMLPDLWSVGDVESWKDGPL